QLVSIFGHDSLPRHIEMLEPDTINLRGIWGKPRPRRRYPEAERTPPRRSVGLSAQVVPETLDLAPERLVRQAAARRSLVVEQVPHLGRAGDRGRDHGVRDDV